MAETNIAFVSVCVGVDSVVVQLEGEPALASVAGVFRLAWQTQGGIH